MINSKLTILSTVLASVLMVGSVSAQTLRVEGGVAVPLTQPQTKVFNDVGGYAGLKPSFDIVPQFDVAPTLGLIALPHANDGRVGTAWEFGGTARLKRSHGVENQGSGFSAVAPFIEGELSAVRTGNLARFGQSLAAGLEWPLTGDSRTVWAGPILRYDNILQDSRPGELFNTGDAHVLTVGLVVEFEPFHKKPVKQEPVKVVAVPVQTEMTPTPSVVVVQAPVKQELHEVVQFAFDSYVLTTSAKMQLDGAVAKLNGSTYSAFTVEGYASSEKASQLRHNQKLSGQRSQAVVDYLVSKGLDSSKLTVDAQGISNPVASNLSESGRVANRRASFTVSYSK